MGFTHFDENGKAVMVDVTAKSETEREDSRDHGCEAYFGSDPHVPYPADHELQDPF